MPSVESLVLAIKETGYGLVGARHGERGDDFTAMRAAMQTLWSKSDHERGGH